MQVSREEFERLALEQIDMIDRLARSLTRSAAEAEDLVQETYVRAVRAAGRFDLREHGIRPWLIRILRNVHATRAAREGRQPSLMADGDLEVAAPQSDEFSATDQWEAGEELKLAMRDLPEELQAALQLWAVDGLSYQEMADAFEIPIGTVMSRLHRAKRLLREAYDKRSRIVRRPGGYPRKDVQSP